MIVLILLDKNFVFQKKSMYLHSKQRLSELLKCLNKSP